MPKEIVPRGILAPSMIVHVLAIKYVLGVPFYRYEQQCAREGFSLDRGTMCRYAEHVGATLGCIVEAARKEAIATAFCLSTDATRVAIQPTPLHDGKRQPCRKGHFFVTLADKYHVFLDFQPKHNGLAVWQMFKGFSGYVQADAHVIYDAMFRGIPPEGADDKPGECGPPPTEVGCFSHARRKYLGGCRLQASARPAGGAPHRRDLRRRPAARQARPVQRKALRDQTVRPLVDAFFTWAQAEHDKRPERGLVATALGYSVRHEQALRRFLDDGRLRMENNSAERELRTVAVGRKNWLVYGSDDHAGAAGNILSLIASCKLHRRDPELYLTEIIRIVPYWTRDRYLDLAPKYWRATRARLSPEELKLPLGHITVPPPPSKEQPSPGLNDRHPRTHTRTCAHSRRRAIPPIRASVTPRRDARSRSTRGNKYPAATLERVRNAQLANDVEQLHSGRLIKRAKAALQPSARCGTAQAKGADAIGRSAMTVGMREVKAKRKRRKSWGASRHGRCSKTGRRSPPMRT
jgi:transposase